jgi:hypothetical protein
MPEQSDPPAADSTILLDSIKDAVVAAASDEPDDCTTQEQYDQARRREELESSKQDREERKKHADNIFILTCSWVVGIYLLLIFQGFQYNGFRLTDHVILAAIGSTTANIVGVFLIVTRYLFPKR